MRSEWRIQRIGDFAKAKGGKRLPAGTALIPHKTRHPYLRIVDFRDGGIDESALMYVPTDVFPSISRYTISPNDIYVSIVGTIGLVGQVPPCLDGANLTENAAKLTDIQSHVTSEYLRYYLQSPEGQHQIRTKTVGSTQPKLALFRIEEIEVPIPPLPEQREITSLLQLLESRIALLRQTNATLESIAQALFKSWFIDFDPVRAKAEGREPEGMDAATAALFPTEFEESALGSIPKGWKLGKFGDIAKLSKGSINPLATPEQEFEHYSLPAFDAGKMPVLERGEAIKSNKTPLPPGSVLQSKLNPHIPRVWLPSRIGERAVCSTEFLPWVAKAPASRELIYCVLTSASFETSVRTLVTGTSNSHQRVKPTQVAALDLVLATDAIAEAFARTVRPLLSSVGENRLWAKNLTELRDTLLPRLISGKLRLPEAEREIEEALA